MLQDPNYEDEAMFARMIDPGAVIGLEGEEFAQFKKIHIADIKNKREEKEKDDRHRNEYIYHMGLDPERKNNKYIGKNTFPCQKKTLNMVSWYGHELDPDNVVKNVLEQGDKVVGVP